MKLLKTLCIALCLTGMAACSGSASYSPEKCVELSDKVKSGATITPADYSEMVDQFVAATELFMQKQKEFGDDKEKLTDFFTTEEGKELMGNVLGFGVYLDQHTSDLSEADIKKMDQVKQKLEEANK